MTYFLQIFTFLTLLISFFINRHKTLQALKIALKKFITILPAFLIVLILTSIVLFIIPEKVFSNFLGGNNIFYGTFIASFLGSVFLIPGFIAFPLCGILLKKGVSYMVLSALTTTLMMVGILTFPVEKEYFGKTAAALRNLISFFIALLVALCTGIFFGEVF